MQKIKLHKIASFSRASCCLLVCCWFNQFLFIYLLPFLLFSSLYFHMNAMMWCDVMCTHIVGSQLAAIISHWLMIMLWQLYGYLFGHFICSSLTWPNRTAVDGCNRARRQAWIVSDSFVGHHSEPNPTFQIDRPTTQTVNKMKQWWLRANRTTFYVMSISMYELPWSLADFCK